MATQRNPKDSMKSTWRTTDKEKWNFVHRQYDLLSLHPTTLGVEVPVHPKTDKVPYISDWQTNKWVVFHAACPLVAHQLFAVIFQRNLGPVAALVMYTLSFLLIGIHQINAMRKLGHIHGFLDGDKHERDQVPDHSVAKVISSLLATVAFREAMAIYLTYDQSKTPLQMNWLALPFEIGLYGVVLDFWFYWYHRIMHEFDSLWKLHRTHHLTKHPNPLLTLYADETQELIDIVGIPLLTYLSLKVVGLPMSYYEWWVCYQYVVFAELIGHSGLRMHLTAPSPFSGILRYFQCELVTEDHDLHHRMGWKQSHNYGKQTRLWDVVFGTCSERIESIDANVDFENIATIPLL